MFPFALLNGKQTSKLLTVNYKKDIITTKKVKLLTCNFCHNQSNDSSDWYLIHDTNNINHNFCNEICFKKSKRCIETNYEVYNCSICCNKIGEHVDSIFCDVCFHWVHRKCIKNLSHTEYESLCDIETDWYCPPCQQNIFPFYNLDDDDYIFCCNNFYFNMSPDAKTICRNLINLEFDVFHNKLDKLNSNISDIEDIDPDKHLNFTDNCKYIVEPKDNIFESLNNNEINIIHINIRSICENFEALQRFLSEFNYKFDVIALSETWLKSKFNIEDYALDGYKTPHLQNRECRAGGGVLCQRKCIKQSCKKSKL